MGLLGVDMENALATIQRPISANATVVNLSLAFLCLVTLHKLCGYTAALVDGGDVTVSSAVHQARCTRGT